MLKEIGWAGKPLFELTLTGLLLITHLDEAFDRATAEADVLLAQARRDVRIIKRDACSVSSVGGWGELQRDAPAVNVRCNWALSPLGICGADDSVARFLPEF